MGKDSLTARELQVATLVAAGLTNSEIAGRLGVSERTVDNGLRRIYARVGLQGRKEFRAWLAVQDAGEAGPAAGGLPAEVSSFVGRDDALFELSAVLGSHRLVTLTGPGGVGKTRLALQAARRQPITAYLVELGRVSDPDLVEDAVMRALGLHPQPGVARRDAIADRVRGAPALLLMDCCEHVIGAAAGLAEHLLRTCADLRILATSREPLMIGGEQVWQVPPLEVPAAGDPLPAEAMRRNAALRLFGERAREAGAASPIRARDGPIVAEICRRLDGLPLALELAAARMRATSPAALLARLDEPDPLGTLVSGHRSADQRHRTLKATVEWSHRLLTPPERRLFARLAVFAGSFDLRAAESVGRRPGTAAHLLSALVDKSLVSVTPGRDDELRYRMLDTLRAFGRERLVQSGEYEAVRERLARHYADVLSEPALSWSRAALYDVEEQLEDVRAALAWSCDNHPELVNLICGKLVGFWGRHGHLGEAREWMDRILERLPNHDRHRALALADAAWLAQRQGDFDAAMRHARECLRIQRLLGGALYIADALNRVADVARHVGEYEEAARCARDALAIRRIEGGPDEICLSLMVLGTALARGGDVEAGRIYLEEARALFPSTDEVAGVAYCDCWLGELEVRAGDHRSARARLSAALSGFREMPDAWMVANLYDLHAWLAGLEGDHHRALRLAGAAAALRREVGASQPPALAAPLAKTLEEARRWVGSKADEVLRQGAEAGVDRVNAYALREAPWRPAASTGGPAAAGSLTARELDVVPLIARGLADKEIAARLGISVRTAEYHVDRIRKKLGLASRAQIAVWAVERGRPPRRAVPP